MSITANSIRKAIAARRGALNASKLISLAQQFQSDAEVAGPVGQHREIRLERWIEERLRSGRR